MKKQCECENMKLIDLLYDTLDLAGALIEPCYRKSDNTVFTHILKPFKHQILLVYKNYIMYVLTGECSHNDIVDYVWFNGNDLKIKDNAYDIEARVIDPKHLNKLIKNKYK